MVFELDMIKGFYENYSEKVKEVRKVVNHPLTLTEKILYAHLWRNNAERTFQRGKDYVDFVPDRVAMQDATAQMVLLLFMQSGRTKAAVPSTVHCDHLIQAQVGAVGTSDSFSVNHTYNEQQIK